MADSFGTQVETMRQAAAHVQDVNAQIQSQLSRLESEVLSLQGAWHGAAAVSFQNLHQRWNTDALKLNQALESIAQAIVGSSTTYQTTDDAHQATFTSITSALG